MKIDLTRCEATLAQLEQMRPTVATALRSTAEMLQSTGTVLNGAGALTIRDYRHTFNRLKEDLQLPDTPVAASLRDFADCLRSQKRLATASAKLDEVLAIRHSQPDRDALLNPVREQAQSIQLQLQTNSAAATELAERIITASHPLTQLLLLVEGQNHATDDEWTSVYDAVESAHGRDVAVAATRGKLVLIK